LGYDLDVPSGAISGAFAIAGTPGSATTPDVGRLSLRAAVQGDLVLGETWTGAYAVRAIPGTYDLVYSAVSAQASVPFNTLNILSTKVTVANGASSVVDIDVPMVTVSGTVTVGGRAAATSAGLGSVVLRRDPQGDEVPLLVGQGGTLTARAIPGTYDVYYRAATAPAADAPRNRNLVVKTGVTLAMSGTTSLDLDIPSVPVGGRIAIGGVAGDKSQDAGILVLRNASGDQVELGPIATGSYSVRAAPGTYDVYYQTNQTKVTEPRNTNARALTGVTITPDGPNTLDIDVPLADVTGLLTINGASVTSESEDVILFLENPETADQVILSPTSFGSFAAKVVAGRYDIVYRGAANGKASTLVPRNKRAILRRGVTINGPALTSIDVDLPSVPLTGSLAMDGAANAQSEGSFLLQGAADPDDVVDLGTVSQGHYALRLVPGTYDVVYDSGTSPRWTIQTGVTIEAATGTLDVDMQTFAIHGALTLNGAAIAAPRDSGTLVLRQRNKTTGTLVLGSTSAGSYSARVPRGQYDVYYQVNTAGAHAPANADARLGCLRVP
ncbi:MAG TPA: hypothetical protein VIU64_10615, partial [Polyangia bacterium]